MGRIQTKFSKTLPVETIIAILISPKHSEHLILTSTDNNLFELFLLFTPNMISLALIIATYLIIIYIISKQIWRLIRNRGRLLKP